MRITCGLLLCFVSCLVQFKICSEMKCSTFLKISLYFTLSQKAIWTGEVRADRSSHEICWPCWAQGCGEGGDDLSQHSVRLAALQAWAAEIYHLHCLPVHFHGQRTARASDQWELSSLPLYYFINSHKWATCGLTSIKNQMKYLFCRDM